MVSSVMPRACTPPDTVVYAIGDVHGCLERLRDLERWIREDAARRTASRRMIVHLGDYVDRGPDSAGVVRHLIERPLAGYETVHLMGNHERMLLDFLDDPAGGATWLANGGVAALASWDVAADRYAARDRAALEELAAAFARRLPAAERRFLEGLRLTHREGGYLFVHAGIRPGVPLDAQIPDDLLWIRGEFLRSNNDHGAVVVHGHTPVEEAEILPNRINVDTGAVYGGTLTAAVLEGELVSLLQARA